MVTQPNDFKASRYAIVNIGELMTFAPLVSAARFSSITEADLGALQKAWLIVIDQKIADFGSGDLPRAYVSLPKIDAQGKMVTPGLIDAHTHPIFGGDRAHEFAARLAGKTYQDIAKAGGGIKYSIRTTRETSDAALLAKTREVLATFLRHGVTTVEAKSGYGQSPAEELRCLRILREAAKSSAQTLQITCLALHDLPADQPSKADFIKAMTDELLPQLAREKLADWVDAFVENGYFSVEETRAYFAKAKALGLPVRMHADEFVASGAAEFSAEIGAASADHLQQASDLGIAAMAKAGTVAVLLPGTSFYAKIPYTQAKRFREAGCAVAVATDYNPGSCMVSNLNFAAALAALYCGLTPSEVLAAITWVAAQALRLGHCKGALAKGFDADIVIHAHRTLDQWIADIGQSDPLLVICRGQVAHRHPAQFIQLPIS